MSHCAGMAGSHIHRCPPHTGSLGTLVHRCRCRTQHDHCTGPRSGKGLNHIHLFQCHSSHLCYKTEKYLCYKSRKVYLCCLDFWAGTTKAILSTQTGQHSDLFSFRHKKIESSWTVCDSHKLRTFNFYSQKKLFCLDFWILVFYQN